MFVTPDGDAPPKAVAADSAVGAALRASSTSAYVKSICLPRCFNSLDTCSLKEVWAWNRSSAVV